jgi:hypothetical protein
MTGSSSDTTLNYARPTKSWIDSLLPYTTSIGKFAEDSSGYLTYTNYRTGGTTGRIFGVQFHRSDTLTSRLVCADTLLKGSDLGRFGVTDQGELVYYASDQPSRPQRVACIRFCPTEEINVARRLNGVIAAGVGTLQDRHTFDTLEYPPLADGNAFERGERGRWWPERSYIYRTNIVGGALRGTNERSYNNAGVFTDFTLYNWADTTLNDTLKWIPGGVVTRFTPFGAPLETRDPLGISSAMKLGYDNRLPIMVAANATYDAVFFQSFEELAGTVAGVAHTGNASLKLDTVSQSDSLGSVMVTSQISNEGMLLRLWVKTSNRGALDSGATNLTVNVDFYDGISTFPTRTYPIARPYRLAQVGEWGLYQFIDTTMGGVMGTRATVTVACSTSGSSFWVDDLVVQPVDAEVVCSVYDRITRRPMAVLDNQGFAAFTQYNAAGAPVRSIVETARGVRTIAEAHGHVPGVYRPVTDTSGTHTIGIGGPTYSISNAGRFRADGDGTDSAQGLGGRFELLDVEIGPDGNKVRVLGSEHPRLPRLEDLHLPSLDTTKLRGLPKLPGGNEYKLIEEYRRLAKQGEAVVAAIDSQSTPSARVQLERQAMSLRAARARILRRLNLTEEEVQGVIEGAETKNKEE